MKKILLVLVILIQANFGHATDLMKFPVYDMIETDFEVMFRLITPKRYGKVILDCQSFIHGINFYKKDDQGKDDVFFKFYLDASECRHIFDFIENSLDKSSHVCIELNSFSGEYLLSQDYKDCY